MSTRPLLAALLGLALVLSACASGDGDDAAAAAADTEPTAEPDADETEAATDTDTDADEADATSDAAEPAELETVSYGIFGLNGDYWPVYIAEAEGFFAEAGIDLDLVVPQDGGGLPVALLSGSIQMATGTPDSFILARGQGQDVEAIMALRNAPTLSLVAAQDVESVEDVRGGLVAVSNPLSGDAFMTRRILAELGLEEGEYDVVTTGGTPDRAAALESGGVQVALLGQPQDFVMLDRGFTLLESSQNVVTDFAWQWTTVESDWAADNAELVERFIGAVLRGVEWWYDPSNEERAKEILIEFTEASPEAAAATYELWQDSEAFQRDLMPLEAAMATVVEFMGSSGQLEEAGVEAPSYEEYVNLGFLP